MTQQIASKSATSILKETMRSAKRVEEMISSQWKQMTPGTMGSLVGRLRGAIRSAERRAECTNSRSRRWNDAPELKAASRQLRNRRAGLARRESPVRNPYDAVVGPRVGSRRTGSCIPPGLAMKDAFSAASGTIKAYKAQKSNLNLQGLQGSKHLHCVFFIVTKKPKTRVKQ